MDSELSFNKKPSRKFHLYSIYFKYKNPYRSKVLRQSYHKSSFFLAPDQKYSKYSKLCSSLLCSSVQKQSYYATFAESTNKTKLKTFKHRWKKSHERRYIGCNVSKDLPTIFRYQNKSNFCVTTADFLNSKTQSREKHFVQFKRHTCKSLQTNQQLSISSISVDSVEQTTIINNSITTENIDNNEHFLFNVIKTQTQSCHYKTRDLQDTQSYKNQTKCGNSWEFLNSTKSSGITSINSQILFESPPSDMRDNNKQNHNDPTAAMAGSRLTKARISSANHEFTPYANYRNFFKWRRYSAMQKFAKFLMPIFILVNMLPLLYAGE